MENPTRRSWPAEFQQAELPWAEPPEEVCEFHSPNDGELYARFQLQNSVQADLLLDEVFGLEPLPATQVSLALRKMADVLDSKREVWARLIAFEGGKPLRQARIEAERAALTLRWSASEAERVAGQVIPMQGIPQPVPADPADRGREPAPWAFTLLEPAGPVLAILAFNHPLNLLAHAVGPALAAGCPIVVKPALETAHTAHWFCREFAQIWRTLSTSTSISPVRLALWSNSQTEARLTDARWGAVQFVGSSQVGWSIARQVHPGVRVLLEHGGAAPAILAEDADVKLAARTLCRHGYFHSGQVCVSLQRVYVLRAVAADFIGELAREVQALTSPCGRAAAR
jgi:acyl-CoA reductase-like NAD-dependent aldehyde dehydrogenase